MPAVSPPNIRASFTALRAARLSPLRRSLHSQSHGLFTPVSLIRLPTSRPRKSFKGSLIPSSMSARRALFTETLPTVLVPPAIFLTCFIGLWSYKIIMTIVFQNKFIYMPYMPPFARSEKIEDYAAACKPVCWEERRVKSLDGTRISLCVGSIPQNTTRLSNAPETARKHVVVIYFQGNGASLPPRLPALTGVLKALQGNSKEKDTEYSVVALSYRGFWTSKGKASQRGIEQDAQATLAWVQENYPCARIVLWGQSLGAGVAANLAVRQLRSASHAGNSSMQQEIAGIILETPFIGIKEMLLALYPQKWLPYRYLWPFLRSWWDSDAALRTIAALRGKRKVPIQMITAARDEIVPESQANHLYTLCKELQLDVRRREVLGALHNEVPTKPDGRGSVVSFVKEVGG